MSENVRSIAILLLVLALAGTSYPLISLLAVSVNNLHLVRSLKSSKNLEIRLEQSKARQQWLALPLIAYVATVLAGIGVTYFVQDPGQFGQLTGPGGRGFLLLASGALLIEVSALVTVLLLPSRSKYRHLEDEFDVWAEVSDKEASDSEIPSGWLSGIEHRRQTLRPSGQERRRTTLAAKVLRGDFSLSNFEKSPKFGFLGYADSGPGNSITLPSALRWIIRRPAAVLAIAAEAYVLAVLVYGLYVSWGRMTQRGVLVTAATAIYVVVCLGVHLLSGRAELVYYSRLAAFRAHVRTGIDSSLVRIKESDDSRRKSSGEQARQMARLANRVDELIDLVSKAGGRPVWSPVLLSLTITSPKAKQSTDLDRGKDRP